MKRSFKFQVRLLISLIDVANQEACPALTFLGTRSCIKLSQV